MNRCKDPVRAFAKQLVDIIGKEMRKAPVWLESNLRPLLRAHGGWLDAPGTSNGSLSNLRGDPSATTLASKTCCGG